MIEIKNLTKKYGKKLAVDHLNLSIAKGELFGFIGPNGAGKTTTLHIMAGILGATEGSATIGGIDVAEEPKRAKKLIGFIPDRPFVYEKLTGSEFMHFIGDLYGVPEATLPAKAEDLLMRFSLYDWANHLIESYSHGMKQRLIIASALLHDPEVLIVDEPMVGLDPAGIRMVKTIFRKLTDNGKTIFMSTHSLEIAEELCDRIGIIHNGRLIALGTTGDLRTTARLKEGDLEEAFLRLTGKDDS